MSMTKQEVLRAYADEKDVQFHYMIGGWSDEPLHEAAMRMRYYTHEPDRWRIKPPYNRIPLGPEDVTPGSVVRMIGTGAVWGSMGKTVYAALVSIWAEDRIRVEGSGWVTMDALKHGWEISRDGGKTWQPCWKEAEE